MIASRVCDETFQYQKKQLCRHARKPSRVWARAARERGRKSLHCGRGRGRALAALAAWHAFIIIIVSQRADDDAARPATA